MNRIKTRIMLICLAPVLLTVLAVQISNWWFIRNYHQQQLASQVATAGVFLQQYLQSREANLLNSAEVITKDFGFRQAVASGDVPTITSMVHNHSHRMQADLLLITDRQGNFVASNQSTQPDMLNLKAWLNDDLPEGEGRFVLLGDQLFRCFILPVKAPRTIAYTLIGYQITPELLTSLQLKTGLALHFVVADGQHIFSSTPAHWQAMDLTTTDYNVSALMLEKSMVQSIPLANIDPKTPIKLYLQADISSFESALNQLHVRSLLMAGVILLLAAWLSSMLAWRLADPLSALYKDLVYRANYDQLTHTLNRHASLQRIREELNRAGRVDSIYCIALCDIDNFKNINDTYGHSVGDLVLRKFTSRLKNAMREYDIFGRFGGEEFVVAMEVLPDEASNAFERLRQIIAVTPIACDQNLISVTMSCGVCILWPDEQQPTLDKILETADTAMYRAKQNGRNQVVFTHVAQSLVQEANGK